MITMTTAVTIPNVQKWSCVAFDLVRGTVTMRVFYGAGQARFTDIPCFLSDAANASAGMRVNPTPRAADDAIVSWNVGQSGQGVGSANSLANAQSAYRGGANHNAGLRAVEGQGIADGWIDGALNGT